MYLNAGRWGLLMGNLENGAEESVCAEGSKRSPKFWFLFLMITALSIWTKPYGKGTNLVVARRMDAGSLEIGPPSSLGASR